MHGHDSTRRARRLRAVAALVWLTLAISPPLLAQGSQPGAFNRAWHTLRDPDAPNWYSGIWKTWKETAAQGDSSLLVPINVLHMRFYYTPEQIANYTEWPLGVGFGRTRVDDTTSRMVFALTMQDSFGDLEYEVGYVWLRNRYPIAGHRTFHLGFGYSLNLLVRRKFGYYPVPVVLPMASIGYRRFTVGATYVPGVAGIGNVLVTGAHLMLDGDGR